MMEQICWAHIIKIIEIVFISEVAKIKEIAQGEIFSNKIGCRSVV